MKLSCISVRALALLPLLFGTPDVYAQAKAAAPAVASTLDVCQDLMTGNWRYSGVVVIAGKDVTAGTAVDYRIQNAASKDGYKDVLRLPKVPGTERGIVSPASGATVHMFSGDAPALTIGTLRNASSVQFVDKAGSVTTTIGEPYTAQICGCPWSAAPARRVTGATSQAWPGPRGSRATRRSSPAA